MMVIVIHARTAGVRPAAHVLGGCAELFTSCPMLIFEIVKVCYVLCVLTDSTADGCGTMSTRVQRDGRVVAAEVGSRRACTVVFSGDVKVSVQPRTAVVRTRD